MWYTCTPVYKSLGTSVPRLGVITSDLRVFGSGLPCARCSVGSLCSLKLVLNSAFDTNTRVALGTLNAGICHTI